MESSRHGVGSVEKALDVLRCFSAQQPELGVSEIARRLDLGVSTVHRLVSTLASRGFVRQNQTNLKYSLDAGLLQLAATVLASSDVRAISLPQMVRLRDLTNETARLHVLVGLQRVCLDQVESHEVIRATGGIGKAYPLHSGAASKVLLAFMPSSDVSLVLAQLPSNGEGIERRARLLEDLERVRQDGYAMSVEENSPSAASLSAPIRDFGGRAIAALTISGPSNRWDTPRMLAFAPTLVEAADIISQELGYSVPATTAAPTQGGEIQ